MNHDLAPQPIRARRTIREIKVIPYGFSDVGILCEPCADDICRAIREGRLETRNFQNDLPELQAEWQAASQGGKDLAALRRVGTNYHAQRIAYFVVHGWEDPKYPIRLDAQSALHDGGHRLRAALFKGTTEIDVIITP
ncbi:MAG TPA: hypothetical protein PLX89_19165 [Verrucomicrobiota bacterium]|nr:hypothetical protein [Verrucomicrobiales bacterium]HRI15122.1 hypothetical protein [Verrucomicrobiota bacterium]